ncbi:hypothetical protein A2630_00740 [Candidatus Woesebacteria bacterium RIFCSPHIGHO2_01_FULL_44_10]|uniref:Uncharacterized protein n=1 Tax=Candidatus Woesebacteria bacterium RIFCSPLOWO2_01_FULL_44_14 TaxID=1802525 RepID=A0A1F8C1W8_9BACT|nr:MAG: hypothetical protein A2630_00740 [Candidatus Woesebacteria bacterium RIFCSPHIGHO2_01_FULL_44_10]OGM54351.1 MAG: hypothetical protein A3F62_01190 [Candidatus Woesebacteria bacterium RIFCSPHIGHO2_12_FULL_44_11]OGM70252.1 MAG: hypothetical protein A2975_04235 [Candidatus Woesebacteria bacterium RIFCSPLOWO2_01_FULL_44_14]
MSVQHKNLASGNWGKMPLAAQLANVGSEVERTISWSQKGNQDYSQKAFARALELLALTKTHCKKNSQLKEVGRIYELLVDYFAGKNDYGSTDQLWKRYFSCYTYLTANVRNTSLDTNLIS